MDKSQTMKGQAKKEVFYEELSGHNPGTVWEAGKLN